MPDYVYEIQEETCIECGQCRRFCPIPDAIVIDKEHYQHTVIADICTGCGLCEAFCPVPNTLVKVPSIQSQASERLKALRRTVWRGQWSYHDHPVMGPLTFDAREAFRAINRANRTNTAAD